MTTPLALLAGFLTRLLCLRLKARKAKVRHWKNYTGNWCEVDKMILEGKIKPDYTIHNVHGYNMKSKAETLAIILMIIALIIQIAMFSINISPHIVIIILWVVIILKGLNDE